MEKNTDGEMQGTGGTDCGQIAEFLTVYADGGLLGDEARRVMAHVGRCAACAEDLSEIQSVLAILHAQADAAKAAPRDEAFWQEIHARIIAQTDDILAQPPLAVATSVPKQIASDKLAPVSPIGRPLWHMTRGRVAAAGLAIAAVLTLFVVRSPGDQSPSPNAAVDQRWTDAMQARFSLDEELSATDNDPFDALDELDDNEVEAVGAALGEDV